MQKVLGVGKKLEGGTETQGVGSFCSAVWDAVARDHTNLYAMSEPGHGVYPVLIEGNEPRRQSVRDLARLCRAVNVLGGGEDDKQVERGINGEDRMRLMANFVDSVGGAVRLIDMFSALPYFTPELELVTEAGYHPISCTYLTLDGVVPSLDEATAARTDVLGRLTDFAYRGPEDLFCAYAALLLGFMAPTINGAKQIIGYLGSDAATGTGTGKGYQADMLQIFLDGRTSGSAGLSSWAQHAGKTIGIGFRAADGRTVRFDNPPTAMNMVDNDLLLAVVTAEGTVKIAVTGRGDGVAIDARRQVVVVTQNQPSAAPEGARRLLPVNMKQRAEGEVFRTPDLRGWVAAHRNLIAMVFADLVLLWDGVGRPKSGAPPMVGFENVNGFVFDPLHYAADQGWLPGVEPGFRLKERKVHEPMGRGFLGLLEAMHRKFAGGKPPTSGALYTFIHDTGAWPEIEATLSGGGPGGTAKRTAAFMRARLGTHTGVCTPEGTPQGTSEGLPTEKHVSYTLTTRFLDGSHRWCTQNERAEGGKNSGEGGHKWERDFTKWQDQPH